jgi:hypothetical protein
MPAYKLYVLDGVGRKISTGEWLAADSDEEVIDFVRAKKLKVTCELWDQARLVAIIPPHRP